MDRDFRSENPALDDMASFALELARRARAETLWRFRNDTDVDDKATDGIFDPVTEADRAAEQAMRQLIRERFPDHGITGEEWPDHAGSSGHVWSLDPVDGTRSFICGLPTWTTLVALLERGAPVLGLVDAPSLDEIYVGNTAGAWLLRGGESSEIRASDCDRLKEARLSTTDPALFDRAGADAFYRLRQQARTIRYGHDAYAYARLAAGSLDLVVESGLKPHDYNPLIPLVSAAGGTIGDWRGGQDYAGGRIIAASTRELFDEAVGYFEALA
jgi:histidinol phosphatase-like enzyme (inositol monophosphatase family)